MGHRDEPLEIKLKTDKKKGVERAIFYFRALQCRLFEILSDALEPRTIIQFGIDDWRYQSGPRFFPIYSSHLYYRCLCRRYQPFGSSCCYCHNMEKGAQYWRDLIPKP
jgi:hypothetical protein